MALNELANKPAPWHDLEPSSPDVIKHAANESVAKSSAPQRSRDLGVDDDQCIPVSSVFSDSQPSAALHLVTTLLGVVSEARRWPQDHS
jgi:hypothetical protein